MKSLKETASIKQISTDSMLKIKRQPETTCPIIDSLIYEGNHRSKVYDISIDYDPNILKVNIYNLIKVSEDLKKWSLEVVERYKEIPKHNIKENDNYEINSYIENINNIIDIDQVSKIEQSASDLNSIVFYWENLYNLKLNKLESDIIGSNLSIKNEFNIEIIESFKSKANSFTEILENTRKNNDMLRSNTLNLKSIIIKYLDKDYFLQQPLDYLKQKESGSHLEISLGVLDTNYHSLSLLRFSKYLKINNVITDIQEKFLDRSINMKDMIELLKNLGYKKFYYYENAQSFLDNQENYKTLDYTLSVKNLSKYKNS